LLRKRRVEGWAQEISDPEEAMGRSLLQRLGDNNRLWVAVVIVLVVGSLALLVQAKRQVKPEESDLYSPPASRPGSYYDDSKHLAFAQSFVERKDMAGKVVSARFAPADVRGQGDRLIIVVAPDTSSDDIEHISLMAAEKNRAAFRTRIRVLAYRIDPTTRTALRVAVTKWVPSRYGFVTTFERHAE
jgi:hypothetical protein